MPNNVKNRITLVGSDEQIKKFVEEFSTYHPPVQHRSFSNDLTFEKDGEYGWLNEETNMFSRRDMEDVEGVPEGFKPHMEGDYTQFPDFDKVIPQPDNIFNGNLGLKEEEMCAREGRPTWSDWNRENWGTKWNSYQNKEEGKNVYTFETAWKGVPKIVAMMSRLFPEVEVQYEYADEDTAYNCASMTFKGGQRSNHNKPEGGSNEAYELAIKLRPDILEYMELVDGEYKYKEDC